MSSRLEKEISELVDHDIITSETAGKIQDYFNSKKTNHSTNLFTVFGVLGSLLIGLGIILVLAHNWDVFSRSIKTCLAFLPLIIGQLLVAHSIVKKTEFITLFAQLGREFLNVCWLSIIYLLFC